MKKDSPERTMFTYDDALVYEGCMNSTNQHLIFSVLIHPCIKNHENVYIYS